MPWLLLVTLSVTVAAVGCSTKSQPGASAPADSTGTIVGNLTDTFAHGNPFYGSVVFLIKADPVSVEWWEGLARYRVPVVYPERDTRLNIVGRTVCTPGSDGDFTFPGVPTGEYFVYARVFWASAMPDSTYVSGNAWAAIATVAVRETVRVTLKPPTLRPGPFKLDAVRAMKAASWPAPTEPDLPKFGEYVYVEELAEAITKAQPEYPDIARMMGVEGSVVVHVLVGKDGRVKDARIVKSAEPMLNRAAERAVRQWVFKPALTGKQPVAVWMAVPVYVGPRKGVPVEMNR